MNMSDKVYIILNEDMSICKTRNGDEYHYKTIEGLRKNGQKFRGKKVAVFQLADIKKVNDLLDK